MKSGFVQIEISSMLQSITGLFVKTSIGSGAPNTIVPARMGKEEVFLSGTINFQGTSYAVKMKIPVIITEQKITRLSIPYLSVLDGFSS